ETCRLHTARGNEFLHSGLIERGPFTPGRPWCEANQPVSFVVLLKLAVNPPVTESTIDGLLPRHALGARPFPRELQPDASGGTRLFCKPLFPGGRRGKVVDGEPV